MNTEKLPQLPRIALLQHVEKNICLKEEKEKQHCETGQMTMY